MYDTLDAAIANLEGFNVNDSLAQRNNNPGNLIPGGFASKFGGTTGDGGFAKFPTIADGFAAQDALVQKIVAKGQTTYQDLIEQWAPPTAPGNSQSATDTYAKAIANLFGHSPTDLVSTAVGAVAESTGGKIVDAAKDAILGSTVVRVAVIGLGLIFVLGGVMLFKPARDAVTLAVKAGGTVAA
jgi:hypothetical protein